MLGNQDTGFDTDAQRNGRAHRPLVWMMPAITFVMPTSGRAEFSVRFTRHLQSQTNEFVLVTEDSFDRTLPDYYAKVNRLLDRVKTPYAMMVDNDDLVAWRTVNALIDSLERHDFVAAGGRISGFRIRGNAPYGQVNKVAELYSPFDRAQTYDSEGKANRILSGFANSWTFYAVHRTEVLKQIWREVAEMALSDLQLHEKFCAMRLLSLGKVKGVQACSYWRQYGTSTQWRYRDDFAMRLMTNKFSADRDAVIDRLELDPHDRKLLVEAWADWWNSWFVRNYGPMAQFRKWVKAKVPSLVEMAKNRRALRVMT